MMNFLGDIMSKKTIIKGAFILTVTGLLTRFIGFFFRIFLSHSFGEEQMGLYQLVFPIFALCFSFTSAGIETALCRCVAGKAARGKKKDAESLLYIALCISVSLSVLLMLLLQQFSTPISIYILGDLRCEELIQLMTYSLPFASIHSCICGYYLGLKQIKVPALSQFVEQVFRVAAVYFAYQVFLANSLPVSIHLAVLGIVIGEIVSALFCFRFVSSDCHLPISIGTLFHNRSLGKELCALAFPLTATRILTNLLQSIETISIPLFLQKYGYTNAQALSTYGVFTGMALPCILFPSAITNAVSTMLLPTVAEIEAESNLAKLKALIRKVIFFGFGLGSFCGIFFLLLGPLVGSILFNSQLTGDFLRTLAWLCPFLYMNTSLISILNGLGKATTSFLINILSLSIRIFGVWWGIFFYGMNGYLHGLLLSQLLVSLCCILSLNNYIHNRELD